MPNLKSNILFKKPNIIVLMNLALLICSCDSGRPVLSESPKNAMGRLGAKLNGSVWEKTYKYAYQSVYSRSYIHPLCDERVIALISELYSNDRVMRQSLIFDQIPSRTGTFKIVPGELNGRPCKKDQVSCSLFTGHDDSGTIIYRTVSNEENYLKVEEYNPGTGEIRGIFQVKMAVKAIYGPQTLPDTIHFTEGRFHTKILINN